MLIRPDPDFGLLGLTVRQPWASQIASGEKPREFRNWATDYRGDLLITAASYPAPGGPRGCAICIVDLWDIGDGVDDWAFGWCLRDPRLVPNVPWRGQLYLWDVPTLLIDRLGLQIERKKGNRR